MRGDTDGPRMSSVFAHRGTQDQSDVQVKGGAWLGVSASRRTLGGWVRSRRAVKDIPRTSVMRPVK